jgi:hypothetical protein
MPSNKLSSLCQQIESQDTDSFAKFYMYVALLNTVSERKKNFTESLPKYSKGFALWQTEEMNFGKLPVDFYQQVNTYRREFINLQPSTSKSLYNIVMAYIRKGTISDLMYIIEQMLKHLTAIHGQQSHNNAIYEYIDFAEKKESITQFIREISEFNQLLLAVVDNSGHTAASLLFVVTGAILILASLFSLIPSLIGLGLIAGGVGAGSYFATQAIQHAQQLQGKMAEIGAKVTKLPQDTSLFGGDKNHLAFFTSIALPLLYAAITAAEQVMANARQQEQVTESRRELDAQVAGMSF